jgi:hypothetical protein
MALRPEKPELCVIESGALGLYKLSAWNYRNRENLFTLRFREPLNFAAYSARGNFLIAAGADRLSVIHPETGEILGFRNTPGGGAAFAATGRSERNMIVYFSNGELLYLDLETGNRTAGFEAPLNLASPLMFGNNRYIAGLDSRGLVVLDAASGEVLDRDGSVPRNSLLRAPEGGTEFYCLVREGASAGVYRFGVTRSGRLGGRGRIPLPALSAGISAFSAGNTIALGTEDGNVLLLDANGRARALGVRSQVRITETAASGSAVAFLTEDGGIGFIPRDYRELNGGRSLELGENPGFSRITPFAGEGSGKFLFWRAGNTRPVPEIRSPDKTSAALGELSFRFPLRTAETGAGKILFLDTSGALSVAALSGASAARVFSFSAPGSTDAAFVDEDTVILGRSAVLGGSPFLVINTATGETVPVPYPSQAGVMVYRGSSGGVYGAAVEQDSEGAKTSILRINASRPSRPELLAEYEGEDTRFSLAETSGFLAASLGGEGVSVYASPGGFKFERSPGLPLKIAGAGEFFIVLDEEGNLCWHEPGTGRLLALFRIYPGEWTLQREDRVLRGAVQNG